TESEDRRGSCGHASSSPSYLLFCAKSLHYLYVDQYLHGAAHLAAPANTPCPAQGRLPCRRATVPIAWRKIRRCGTTSKPRAALRAHRCTTGGTLPASKTGLPAVCGLGTADIYTFF